VSYVGNRDWLLADDSYLPTNQLPLLRSFVGQRLVNIRRYIAGSLEHYEYPIEPRDFFRKGEGPMIFDMDDLPPVHFRPCYSYHLDEKSIDVGLEPLGPGVVEGYEGERYYHPYTLYDHEYVDEGLMMCIGQRVEWMRILIRLPEVSKDFHRARQGGVEVSFENGMVIIVSYYLNKATTRSMQLLYPEEIRWEIVRYAIDVMKGRTPLLYRFNRWMWRALERLGRRLGY
jgi:hypothetical protein